MNKFILIGILLIVIIGIVIWTLSKNKKGTIVLGQEMADASRKEKARIDSGNYAKSPLPDLDYSNWPNEESLINPKENELDSAISELCKKFKNSSEDKRNEIRKSISQNNIYTLLEFSKRATLLGVRKREETYISDGFVAISMIESERCDYRDVLVALSFLNHGIQKLDLDNSEIFETAVRFSEQKTGRLIKEFTERWLQDKSVEIMGGYTEIETSYGVSFIQTNYEAYHPEKNLVKILFEISDYISGDKYSKGTITTGEKIASIWLSADNDKKLEQTNATASGCASLRMNLRNEFDSKSGYQMFLIYLAEFKDRESLQTLINQTKTTTPTSFSRLAVTEGNLFCVIIQRAIMANVKDFETNKSLMRFETPIREILKKIDAITPE